MSRCLALALTVFLLAQAGTPLTSGFLAKFYAIGAVVDAGSSWLGVIAMLTAVVSAFMYLRIVLAMYAGSDDDGEAEVTAGPRIVVPWATKLAIVAAVVATIGIGILPDPLTKTARDATPDIVADADAEPPAAAPGP